MPLVINTNIASLIAQANIAQTNALLKLSVARLTSGFRINSAADDSAGLARADKLRAQSRMIQASMRNANDGISALEVADKAAEQITNILTRMGELAASAAQGTLDDSTRSYYSDEYDQLKEEVERIAQTTEFGGNKLLEGSVTSLTMFIGFKNSSYDQLSISMVALTADGAAGDVGLSLSADALSSVAGALEAIDTISAALGRVNDARSVYGSSSNRLSISLSNLQTTFSNFQAAESRIRDADYAYETAMYMRNKMMVEAGISVLAQANLLPQNVLTLLK
jgi:flagellin